MTVYIADIIYARGIWYCRARGTVNVMFNSMFDCSYKGAGTPAHRSNESSLLAQAKFEVKPGSEFRTCILKGKERNSTAPRCTHRETRSLSGCITYDCGCFHQPMPISATIISSTVVFAHASNKQNCKVSAGAGFPFSLANSSFLSVTTRVASAYSSANSGFYSSSTYLRRRSLYMSTSATSEL